MHDPVFDLTNGFLPTKDPMGALPAVYEAWASLALALPKLLTSDETRATIEALPPFDLSALDSSAVLERAMVILSYLGHAYVWNNATPVDHIPAVLAVPWAAVAKQLGRPPVLSYASYALYNWRRLDPDKPVALGNIVLLQNFLGGIDEEWFILIHVEIEAQARQAVDAFEPTHAAVNADDGAKVLSGLQTISNALDAMCKTLERMPEHCDPYIYFNRVRPYIHGWKDNPALPNGVVYEGVADYGQKPQFFKGETGAQSTIIPSMDAFFGVEHEDNPLKIHLDEMRIYMPPVHRKFLERIEQKSQLRPWIQSQNDASLRAAYNSCIALISRFRHIHIGYAAQYIHKQSQVALNNPTAVGTGGTPFMAYLQKHVDETETFLL